MSLQWNLVVLALIAACNSGKPMANSTEGKQSQSAPGAPRETPDWSGKKLVPETGEIDDIAFTIDVPQGLPRSKRNKADWDTDEQEDVFVPKIYTSTIEIARIQDLDKAKYNATLDAKAKTWVREQQKPDSIALTMADPDKSRIEAITYVQANDTQYIKCKAVQATGEGPLPSYAKTRQMLETICDSLKPTGAAEAPAGKNDGDREGEAEGGPKKIDTNEAPAPAKDDGPKGRLEGASGQ
jgi:hypothetical protein